MIIDGIRIPDLEERVGLRGYEGDFKVVQVHVTSRTAKLEPLISPHPSGKTEFYSSWGEIVYPKGTIGFSEQYAHIYVRGRESLHLPDIEDPKLKRKLRALDQRAAMIQILADFLKHHPTLASGSDLKPLNGVMCLYFEDRAFIRPVWNKRATLRLEKYVEDQGDDTARDKRVICEDLSKLCDEDLSALLRKIKIDLDDPENDLLDDE